MIETRGGNPMLTATTHYPKYLNLLLMVLFATYTIGLVFVEKSKQGVVILCLMCSFGQNIGSLHFVSRINQDI